MSINYIPNKKEVTVKKYNVSNETKIITKQYQHVEPLPLRNESWRYLEKQERVGIPVEKRPSSTFGISKAEPGVLHFAIAGFSKCATTSLVRNELFWIHVFNFLCTLVKFQILTLFRLKIRLHRCLY